MKIMQAETTTNSGHQVYRFTVWIDDTKVQANGTPDPNWIETIDYSTTLPDGITDTNSYMTWIQGQITTWAADQVNVRNNPPTSPAQQIVT